MIGSGLIIRTLKQAVLTALLLGIVICAAAQDNKGILSGKITDLNGLPVTLANIAVDGTAISTQSDENGNYLLKLEAGAYTLLVTALGYQAGKLTAQVTAGITSEASVGLQMESFSLSEVTVSGLKVKSVTATRTLMEIKDIPQAIVVLGQKTIRQQAVFDLTTLTRNITGLNFSGSYGGGGSSQFFNARGFDLNETQNYRLNGMMLPNLGNNYSENIEQVEFLKGPASILFGDVAPGGVINLVTKKPLSEFMADFSLKAGSWGLLRPALDITGPLTKDNTVRYRVNTSYERSDSFRDFVRLERGFIAPTLAWDISPRLSMTVETVFKRSSAVDDAGLVSPDGTVKGLKSLSPSLYLGDPTRRYNFSDQSYFTTLAYQLGKTWRLKAAAFYGHTKVRPFGIWFDQPESNGDFVRREYGYHQHSGNGSAALDASGTFYTGAIKHNLLIGADYQGTRYRFTNVGELSYLDINNIYEPAYPITSNPAPASTPLSPYVSIISRTGLYVQDQVMLFNERFHVLLGLRAGTTRQGNDYYEDELAGTQFEGYADNIISKTALSPRIGLLYKPILSTSVYASWSKGYEVNSPDIFARNYLDYATPPATVSQQFEAGVKTSFFNERLGIAFSGYQIDKRNPYGYVYLDPENPNFDEYDVYYQGRHQSRGIEMDVDGWLSKSVSLTAGFAYVSTRVVEDPGYPKGNLLPNAPKYTANLWLNYEPGARLAGFTAGVGFFYKHKFFSSLANNPDLEIPAGYTLDAALGYKFRRFSLQVNVMNLSNQLNYLNPWQFNLFDVRPPRQYVVSMGYGVGTGKGKGDR